MSLGLIAECFDKGMEVFLNHIVDTQNFIYLGRLHTFLFFVPVEFLGLCPELEMLTVFGNIFCSTKQKVSPWDAMAYKVLSGLISSQKDILG